jgi:hypothetical protein
MNLILIYPIHVDQSGKTEMLSRENGVHVDESSILGV